MPHHLPLLQARAAETRLCTYCPKLCRPACPVSTVEGRETVTPWGKMRAMGELTEAQSTPSDASRAAMAWACTQCNHCRTLCLLDNPAADTLYEGRADLFARGEAPDTVNEFVRRWPARLEKLRAAAASLALPVETSPVAFVPGCTRVKFEGSTVSVVARAVGVLTRAPEDRVNVVADACCGAPLHDAGDRAGFEAHARKYAKRFDGASRVVVADAGCAYTLRRTYPLYGIALPTVEHLAETAMTALDKLRPVSDGRAVRYHDSCKLGRGLGVYDAPRAVLKALRGAPCDEMPGRRDRASCSGGGGLLPITRRGSAEAIADDLAEESQEGGEAVVVTGCATTRRRLTTRGIAAEDLADWIARGVL